MDKSSNHRGKTHTIGIVSDFRAVNKIIREMRESDDSEFGLALFLYFFKEGYILNLFCCFWPAISVWCTPGWETASPNNCLFEVNNFEGEKTSNNFEGEKKGEKQLKKTTR